MSSFTPPTVSWAWPTGSRLLDRLQLPRGISVVTNGQGGWTNEPYPWLGNIENLIEGTDYFLGGHFYQNLAPTVATSLTNAGYTLGP